MLAAVALSLTATSAAFGVQQTSPQRFPGNLDCGDGYQAGVPHNLKIDPPGNGTYDLDPEGQIVIENYDGNSFDWYIPTGSLDIVDAYVVLVKGGPWTNVYFYGSFDDSDKGLTAAVNLNNKHGKTYGISHITFCFDEKA